MTNPQNILHPKPDSAAHLTKDIAFKMTTSPIDELFRILNPSPEQRLEGQRRHEEQMSALQRLWQLAQGHSGQCRRIADFLLGLYNGRRFPFDLTNFRALDDALFKDCLRVLELDSKPSAEVHKLLGVSGLEFERLAEDWRIVDLEALMRNALPPTT